MDLHTLRFKSVSVTQDELVGTLLDAELLVLTVVDEMCFFSISAQGQTSGLTACAEHRFARVCHAAEFPKVSKRPAVAKYRDTARQAAADTERP